MDGAEPGDLLVRADGWVLPVVLRERTTPSRFEFVCLTQDSYYTAGSSELASLCLLGFGFTPFAKLHPLQELDKRQQDVRETFIVV